MNLDTPLRVLTYNIRHDEPNDPDPFTWAERKGGVAALLRRLGADVFGLQEVLEHQLRDIGAALPGYAHVGRGHDGAHDYTPASGEHTPVFYRLERLELQEDGTFWLSSTPEVPGSRYGPEFQPRIATWARFRDKRSGHVFTFCTTHFPYQDSAEGEAARAFSARVLLAQLEGCAGRTPIILTGDFNLTTTNEADRTRTYRQLRRTFDDAYDAPVARQGPEATFLGFDVTQAPGARIDYIFSSAAHRISVLHYETVSANNGTFYFSDHAPVLADVRF